MDILIQIPTGTDMEKISDGLVDVGDELHVDITFGA